MTTSTDAAKERDAIVAWLQVMATSQFLKATAMQIVCEEESLEATRVMGGANACAQVALMIERGDHITTGQEEGA